MWQHAAETLRPVPDSWHTTDSWDVKLHVKGLGGHHLRTLHPTSSSYVLASQILSTKFWNPNMAKREWFTYVMNSVFGIVIMNKNVDKFLTRLLYDIPVVNLCIITMLPKVSWTLTTRESGNNALLRFPPLPMNNQLPFLLNLQLVPGNSAARCAYFDKSDYILVNISLNWFNDIILDSILLFIMWDCMPCWEWCLTLVW